MTTDLPAHLQAIADLPPGTPRLTAAMRSEVRVLLNDAGDADDGLLDVDYVLRGLLQAGWLPPPAPPLALDQEPTDLAARVVDDDADVWAKGPDGWVCLTHKSEDRGTVCAWSTLVAESSGLWPWEGGA